jgi:hypothetical protein
VNSEVIRCGAADGGALRSDRDISGLGGIPPCLSSVYITVDFERGDIGYLENVIIVQTTSPPMLILGGR